MRRLGILLAASMLLVSCAGLPARKVMRNDPSTRALRHDIVTSLRRGNEVVQSLRGLADVRYGSNIFGARGEIAFAIQRPYRLRIDGLAEFGLYSSQLALTNVDLVILWPGDNRYYRGAASPETMGRYLQVSLDPERVIELLLGVVPIEDEEDYAVKRVGKGQNILLQGRRGEMVVESKDGGGGYLPIEYTSYDTDGSKSYRVRYEDYRLEGAAWLPGRIQVKFSGTHSRIEIAFKEVEINPRMDGKLFEIRIPQDAKEINAKEIQD